MIVSNDTIIAMKPPYIITDKALNLSLAIANMLGHLEGVQSQTPQAELRKQNRIKTIQGSLAIEGNTLSTSQVTALIANKRVVGPQKDILEVVNAINAYEAIHSYQPYSANSMLKAHKRLMNDLIVDPGQYRQGNVGIFKGGSVSHVAPKYSRVPTLMKDLFEFLKKEEQTHPLIKSCVFHYKLMFIHPFSDGNGRIGRLWQCVILMEYHPIFEYLSMESLIKEQQTEYYKILEACDKQGDSTLFIEFLLSLIKSSLTEFKDQVTVKPQTPTSRLATAKAHFSDKAFSRKEYLALHKLIASATASRDLMFGVENHILQKLGDKVMTRYQFLD